jgi:REP element-mobilizing transposase RayT
MLRQWPLAYLITFHTYGTWLHGHDEGSVDRRHNGYGAPTIKPDAAFAARRRKLMTHEPLVLTGDQRRCADAAMREVCAFRGWGVHAVNVRTTHAHAVVAASVPPERIMGDLKRRATRLLREGGLVAVDHPVWQEHGSTRWLWDARGLADACHYVVNGQ